MTTTYGNITLIIGSMFSGKTTELIRQVKLQTLIGKKCFVINHDIDDRYGDTTDVKTHDGLSLRAFSSSILSPLLSLDKFKESGVVAINEGQFFGDLLPFCEECSKLGKNVIVCALRGDSDNKMFKSIVELLPRADNVITLNAKCLLCRDGTDAPFTVCNVKKTSQVLVGGAETYSAVCAKHYYEITNKQ